MNAAITIAQRIDDDQELCKAFHDAIKLKGKPQWITTPSGPAVTDVMDIFQEEADGLNDHEKATLARTLTNCMLAATAMWIDTPRRTQQDRGAMAERCMGEFAAALLIDDRMAATHALTKVAEMARLTDPRLHGDHWLTRLTDRLKQNNNLCKNRRHGHAPKFEASKWVATKR